MWWTEGKDDDTFWRSQASGARATIRRKKGKNTKGQYGDLCATSAKGSVLTEQIIFELKCGYNSVRITDLVDKPPRAKTQVIEAWIDKVYQAMKDGNTFSWIFIHKRARKEVMVFFPAALFNDMEKNKVLNSYRAKRMLGGEVRFRSKTQGRVSIKFMKWCDFLEMVDPAKLRTYLGWIADTSEDD